MCPECGEVLTEFLLTHLSKCKVAQEKVAAKRRSGATVTCRCGATWYNVQAADFLHCKQCGRHFEIIWTERGYQLYES